MGTSLRGFGYRKKELIEEIHLRYGSELFTYRQVSRIRNFSKSTFLRLSYDGLIRKVTPDPPCFWQLSEIVCRDFLNYTIDDLGDGAQKRPRRKYQEYPKIDFEVFTRAIQVGVEYFRRPGVVG